ncbi:uncharacterized protein BO97DRAFT_28542 [Aspergillus homomorphus CBS 101889]|uniref:Uncharacterized protein n=1 Tax=Aspergillus homomorphus (strain CBS 101889) TaxID=1450537 RepID=A0A395I1E4_ASPHC|nr:hypothetical protein BO97DRAFT_28542 [Aspergillus homomorphus CBS 101889]RAL13880.1 hypothetical protein BO97DRAFT_28542 [Aspergillus homomorphus CBS 101889]
MRPLIIGQRVEDKQYALQKISSTETRTVIARSCCTVHTLAGYIDITYQQALVTSEIIYFIYPLYSRV